MVAPTAFTFDTVNSFSTNLSNLTYICCEFCSILTSSIGFLHVTRSVKSYDPGLEMLLLAEATAEKSFAVSWVSRYFLPLTFTSSSIFLNDSGLIISTKSSPKFSLMVSTLMVIGTEETVLVSTGLILIASVAHISTEQMTDNVIRNFLL